MAPSDFILKRPMSLGLDPGYDAGHFNQSASLMSRLVDEDQGVGFAVNAMGIASINDVVVPLVINRAAGVDFRISIDTFGLSAGTNVYLEDNQQGTMTLLNEQDFELIPEINLSEVGRFVFSLIYLLMLIKPYLSNFLNVFKLQNNNFITVEKLKPCLATF